MSNEIIEHESKSLITSEIQQMLDTAAKEQSMSEVSSIPFISLKGKKFTVGDDKLGTTLKVVILADVFDHSWYDRKYDPSSEDVFPPACFAIGNDQPTMAPHADSPVPQSNTCELCPKNEFGSSENGKGKACRNGRRILIASIGSDERVNFGDLAIINMSPTALKGFSKYVKSITNIKRLPLWAVVTTLFFDEDAAYPVLVPAFDSLINGEDIGEIVTRMDEWRYSVAIPYNVADYEAPDSVEEVAAKSAKKSKMS